jgi:uncharacterized protein
MINRIKYLDRVQAGLRRSPVVALIGPRQCGKTTLARQVLPRESPLYFDLEDPVVAAGFESPMSSLAPLRGLVVIDFGECVARVVAPGRGVAGGPGGDYRDGGL